MSKSAPNPSSKILLTDTVDQIHAKIKSAVTDSIQGVSYDPIARPGISGLLEIYSGYSGENVHSIGERFQGERGIRDFKESLAVVVSDSLASFRSEYERVRKDESYLIERENVGAMRAKEAASVVMGEVKAAVGTN